MISSLEVESIFSHKNNFILTIPYYYVVCFFSVSFLSARPPLTCPHTQQKPNTLSLALYSIAVGGLIQNNGWV